MDTTTATPTAITTTTAAVPAPCSSSVRDTQTKMEITKKRKRRSKPDKTKWVKSFRSMIKNRKTQAWQTLINESSSDMLQAYKEMIEEMIDARLRLDFISRAPYEISVKILSYLDPQDICKAAQTNKFWRQYCKDPNLWRHTFKKFADVSDLDTLIARCSMPQETNSSTTTKPTTTNIASTCSQTIKKLNYETINWMQMFKIFVQILKNWRDEKKSKLIELKCHEEHVITCLQFNPKSNIVVSGSDDHKLNVWSADTGQRLQILSGHTGGVWCSQISKDDTVISGSTDKTIRIWNAPTGELIHTLTGHTSTVRCLALCQDRVVSGSRDTTVRLWNIRTGKCLNVLKGHDAAVRCVEFKDNIIVSGAYDSLVKVWNATTGVCVHTLHHHTDRIYCLQFDGDTIASGSLDSTICLWDAKTGALKHQLKGHKSLTSKMYLKDDLLVSANADSFCKVWNVQSGECLHTLGGDNGHTSAITSVHSNYLYVITSGDDGYVKLWDIKTGKFIRDLIKLPCASQGGVVWRMKASYSKLVCAVGSRSDVWDNTHIMILKLE